MSAVKLWLSASTARDAYRVLLCLTLLLVASAALTVLPVIWLVVGLLALVVGTLTFVKPQMALYLLCFSVPFGSLLSVDLGGFSVGLTDALLGLALAAWLARTIAFRQPITWSRLALPTLLFVSATAFSLPHAASLPLAAKELAKWLEFLAVLLIVTDTATKSRRHSHILVSCLLVAGIAQACLGAYQFLTRSGPEFFAFGRFLRAYGTFEQPNPFGGYLGLIAPLALALVLGSGSHEFPPWLKWLALSSLAAMGAGIAMSGSRGAWLGAAVWLGILTVAHGRRGQVFLVAGILVIAVAGLLGGASTIPDQVLDRITGFLPLLSNLGAGSTVTSIEVTDANYANLERLAFWQAAADMWADRLWLGVGFGNYQAAYALYSLPKWRMALGHAHNYYLNIAAETGLLGLSAYLALWAAAIWRLAKRVRGARPGYVRALALGALGVVVHASVHNLVDNLWVHHMYIHTAIILGLAETRAKPKPASS